MEHKLLEVTHELLFQLLPLYFEKLGVIFKKADKNDLYCNKNQNRAILMIKRQGKITPTQLGRQLDMEKGSLTTLIDSLEGMNLLAREPYISDRRKVLLSLTQEGQEYFEQMIAAYQKYLAEILEDTPGEDIAEFAAHLEYVVKFLERL